MPLHVVDAQQERAKRELRMQIGRMRRRIAGRIRATGRHTRRMQSWRTYVEQYPGSAIMAALGAGLALSAGLSAGRLSRWLGLRLIRKGINTATEALWKELQGIWTASTPDDNQAQAAGGDDART